MAKAEHEPVLIIGGGMIGRIVQRHVPTALILDWNKEPLTPMPPPQLGANYLWAPVADLPCAEFSVVTTIDGEIADDASIRAYKDRVGKSYECDINMEVVRRQFVFSTRGFAFQEFPPPTRIRYAAHVSYINLTKHMVVLKDGSAVTYDTLVSTIPLPALLRMNTTLFARYGHIAFPSFPIWIKESWGAAAPTVLTVDYRTTGDVYRMTTRPDGRTYEEYMHPVPGVETRRMTPGRIHDAAATPEILGYIARQYSIQCFGRYARWDSNELTHQSDRDITLWSRRMV